MNTLEAQEKELFAFFDEAAAVRAPTQAAAGDAELAEEETLVKEFALAQVAAGRKVVCLTSGGTTVPLEHNTVRFIDNFSTGKRGAAMAERFLEEGYSVILLSRQNSAMPFARIVQEAINCQSGFNLDFMDALEVRMNSDEVMFKRGAAKSAMAVRAYQAFKPRIMPLHFTSLSDYLHKLRSCAQGCSVVGKEAVFVLAAAVSDFHVPPQEMVMHKIQSRNGPLEMSLAQVPKALGILRHRWAPEAFFVSFKLETDCDILIKKARGAIEKYQMDLVVANELKMRYQRVFLVEGTDRERIIEKTDDEELEVPMVRALVKAHGAFCDGSRPSAKRQNTN